MSFLSELCEIVIFCTVTMYAVVVFTDTEQADVVPQSWIVDNGSCCYWPPYTSASKITKAVKTQVPVGPNWTRWTVRLLGTYGKLIIFFWLHRFYSSVMYYCNFFHDSDAYYFAVLSVVATSACYLLIASFSVIMYVLASICVMLCGKNNTEN